MSRTVSLPMYDFEEVRVSTNALREAIAQAIRELREDVIVATDLETQHETLLQYWRGSEMYISQSCGLPIVENLDGVVDILGTFLWSGVSDDYGNYRTSIVIRGELAASEVAELRGAQPVVNSVQSLSGWCSLGCALAEVTDDPAFVRPYLISGHHAGSLQLLQDGIADVASIDSATLQLLRRLRPSLVNGLRVIGAGPLIPATPVIVGNMRNATIASLRSAMHRVVGQDSLAIPLSEIGIVGFVNKDFADYKIVHDLVTRAERVLPRRE